MQPTVIWKVICALSGILAIRESESNASKIVLEKLENEPKLLQSGKRRRWTDFTYS
jgi:hypothetical protein